MPPRLTLVPVPPLGPRRVDLLGELRIGDDAPAPFHERSAVQPHTGTTALGAVRERSDDLRVDLDAHGAVQDDGALVVTITLQVRHRAAAAGVRALEAETTVVAVDLVAPFELVCRDPHGCCAVAVGSIGNAEADTTDPE